MDDPTERWLPVVGYEGLYDVSDLGQVRSLPRQTVTGVHGGRVLKPWPGTRGYLYATLSRDGKKAHRQVHSLVLEAFHGPRPEGQEGRHGPNGKLDNRASELRWGTQSENYGADRVRDGTSNRGERNGQAKLTAEIVSEFKRQYIAGKTQYALAKEYGVTQQTVSDVILGRRWKHMSTPQIIYLATSGEYSDYSVRHAFARREDAEAYPLGDHVEEYELHDGPVDVRTWHILYWNPRQPDHEGDKIHRLGNPWLYEHRQDFDGKPGNVSHHWSGPYHAPEIKTLRVEGWDLERVRKVYSEQRARHKAAEAGL